MTFNPSMDCFQKLADVFTATGLEAGSIQHSIQQTCRYGASQGITARTDEWTNTS